MANKRTVKVINKTTLSRAHISAKAADPAMIPLDVFLVIKDMNRWKFCSFIVVNSFWFNLWTN